jgi:chromosome segregation ATPase
MGRQALVTLDHVKTAVTALQAEGKPVSSRSVREKLGNVGSMGTINRLLQMSAADKDRKPDSLRQLPPDLQRTILDFTDQQANGARAQIAEELVACRLEMADLATENERLSAAVEELRIQLETTAAEKAVSEGRLAQLTSELAMARKETAAERSSSENVRIDLVRLQLRVEALTPLERELNRTRLLCEGHRDVCVRLEQANAVLDTQREALESQVHNLKNELLEAHTNSAGLSEKTEKIAGILEQERTVRVLAERELAVAKAMLGKRNAANHAKNGRRQSNAADQKSSTRSTNT